MNPKHQDKINEIINSHAANLRLECERLYRSGMIDPEQFNPDEYVLAKILLTAAIDRTKYDWRPLDNGYRQEVKNLILA